MCLSVCTSSCRPTIDLLSDSIIDRHTHCHYGLLYPTPLRLASCSGKENQIPFRKHRHKNNALPIWPAPANLAVTKWNRQIIAHPQRHEQEVDILMVRSFVLPGKYRSQFAFWVSQWHMPLPGTESLLAVTINWIEIGNPEPFCRRHLSVFTQMGKINTRKNLPAGVTNVCDICASLGRETLSVVGKFWEIGGWCDEYLRVTFSSGIYAVLLRFCEWLTDWLTECGLTNKEHENSICYFWDRGGSIPE